MRIIHLLKRLLYISWRVVCKTLRIIRNILRYTLLTLLGALVLWLLYALIFLSNFEGICKEDGRKLTKEELLSRALPEIYKEEKYCCEVLNNIPAYKRSPIGVFINRWHGFYNYFVYAYYERIYDGDNYYEAHIVINECGEVKNKIGIGVDDDYYFVSIKKIKEKTLQGENNHE